MYCGKTHRFTGSAYKYPTVGCQLFHGGVKQGMRFVHEATLRHARLGTPAIVQHLYGFLEHLWRQAAV